MNERILRRLKVVVEQAVRPVRASFPCKRRMREELLDHLVAVYGEESGRLDDEQAVLKRTERRFGEPGELSDRLQSAVSRWSRFRYLLEKPGLAPENP